MEEIKELTFEQALNQVEAYARNLESGELSLEASLECYEKGKALIERCRKQLEEAKNKLEELSAVKEEG